MPPQTPQSWRERHTNTERNRERESCTCNVYIHINTDIVGGKKTDPLPCCPCCQTGTPLSWASAEPQQCLGDAGNPAGSNPLQTQPRSSPSRVCEEKMWRFPQKTKCKSNEHQNTISKFSFHQETSLLGNGAED